MVTRGQTDQSIAVFKQHLPPQVFLQNFLLDPGKVHRSSPVQVFDNFGLRDSTIGKGRLPGMPETVCTAQATLRFACLVMRC